MYAVMMMKNTKWQLSFIATHALLTALENQNELENRIMSHAWLVEKLSSMKECEMIFLRKEEHVMNCKTPIDTVWRQAIKHLNGCPYDDNKIWQMALAKIEGVLPEKIRTIKNNSPKLIELDWNLKPCDLIYNSPPYMIYTIPKEKRPNDSCTLELESIFNSNSNSDNDNDKNNGSSSA
ncbi:hypothetical protein G9A89_009105 [Geosiphon pyriformis]|nr:hypothetical protein G9A89_009105 [Geosiphon pyriformis]